MALDFPNSPSIGQLYPSPPTAGVPVWKWDGSEWVATANTGSTGYKQFEFTATAGQTVFSGADINGNTLAYSVGYAEVHLNGALLNKADYTASNGTSITLAFGVNLNDQVTILALATTSTGNALLTSNNLSDLASISTAKTNLGLGTGQINGTATNDNASAGNVGEYIVSNIAVGSEVTLTSGSGANLTSISLTAGDWDISANLYFDIAGTTTITLLSGSISPTSGAFDATLGATNIQRFASFAPGGQMNVLIGPLRVSLASTTTYFAVVQANFATSTCKIYGQLRARRVR